MVAVAFQRSPARASGRLGGQTDWLPVFYLGISTLRSKHAWKRRNVVETLEMVDADLILVFHELLTAVCGNNIVF